MVDISRPTANIGGRIPNDVIQQNLPNIFLRNAIISVPQQISSLALNSSVSGVVIAQSKTDNITTIKTNLGEIKVRTPIDFRVNDKIAFALLSSGEELELQLISMNDRDVAWLKANATFSSKNPQTTLDKIDQDIEIEDHVLLSKNDLASKVKATMISVNHDALKEILPKLLYKKEINTLPLLNELLTKENNGIFDIESKLKINIGSIIDLKILSSVELLASTDNNIKLPINLAIKEDDSASIIFTAKSLQNKNNQTFIKTPFGLIRLDAKYPNITENSLIEFEMTGIENNEVSKSHPIKQNTVNHLITKWNYLIETIDLLKEYDEKLVTSFVKNNLPMANNQLLAKILRFTSAIKEGDAQKWLGPDITNILNNNQKAHLIEKISADFVILKDSLTDESNEWQALIAPIYDGEELRQTTIYIKNNRKKEQYNHENGTRFIVELDSKNLGQIQLDGFLKIDPTHKIKEKLQKFDLVVRLIRDIKPEFKETLISIFNNATRLSQFNGAITFERVKIFPIRPMTALAPNKAATRYNEIY